MSRINPGKFSIFDIVLALAPSCVFYCFIPFTWNNIDAEVYFMQPLSSAFPHYPPLYNAICLAVLGVGDGSPIVVNVIVAFQHIVYSCGLLYVASVFSKIKHRIIFLLFISFNWTILTFVNGIFPEGLYAGFQLFFWGALFKFFMEEQNRFRSGIIWALSMACLAFTKNIGELYYAFAISLSAVLVINGKFKITNLHVSIAGKLLGFTTVSLFSFLLIQNALVWYLHCPNSTVIGRQAEYRIRELPWGNLTKEQKENLLTHYTAGNSDPILRTTFELIFATLPWYETHIAIDSVLHSNNIHDKTPDDYLNTAYKQYLLHLDNNALQSMFRDATDCITGSNLASSIVQVNTLAYFHNGYQCHPDLKRVCSYVFAAANEHKLEQICSSRLYQFFTDRSPGFFFKWNLILFAVLLWRRRTVSIIIWLLPTAYAYLYVWANAMATIFLMRYSLPPLLELHLTAALLAATFFIRK